MTSPPAFRAERSAWRHSAGGYTGRGASSGYRGTVPRNLANLFTPKRDKGASPRPASSEQADIFLAIEDVSRHTGPLYLGRDPPVSVGSLVPVGLVSAQRIARLYTA